MLKETITYKDLDGKEVVEDFYFALSKAEIAELEMSQKGGLSVWIAQVTDAEDGKSIIQMFKDVIGMTVGVRSEDGKRFIKTPEIRDNFMQTDAYSELFMRLVTDADYAARFIRGVVPADLADAIDIEKAKNVNDVNLPNEIPAWVKEDRDPTGKELAGMSREEMQAAFQMREKRNRAEATS